MSETTKHTPGPVVTLSKGGTKERTVKVSELVIPDLWFVGESPDGVEWRTRVLECWHMAHDLKRELEERCASQAELLEACKAVDALGAIVGSITYHDENESVLLTNQQWRQIEAAWAKTRQAVNKAEDRL